MKRLFNCYAHYVLVLIMLLSLSSCAVPPLGPSMAVMPAPGKPLDMFNGEVSKCKKFAFDSIGGQDAVDKVNNAAITNTLVGAGTGILLGALIGGAGGDAGSGAQIGAAGGIAMGAGSGVQVTAQGNQTMQQMYDQFYTQCMYSLGNQVPGMAPAVAPVASSGDPKVFDVQQALASAGYDTGEINGIMNSKTKKAIRSFQKDNSLKVTGLLDKKTMSMLSSN